MTLHIVAITQVIGNKAYSQKTVWNISTFLKTVRIKRILNPVQHTSVVIIGKVDRFMPRNTAAEKAIVKSKKYRYAISDNRV